MLTVPRNIHFRGKLLEKEQKYNVVCEDDYLPYLCLVYQPTRYTLAPLVIKGRHGSSNTIPDVSSVVLSSAKNAAMERQRCSPSLTTFGKLTSGGTSKNEFMIQNTFYTAGFL